SRPHSTLVLQVQLRVSTSTTAILVAGHFHAGVKPPAAFRYMSWTATAGSCCIHPYTLSHKNHLQKPPPLPRQDVTKSRTTFNTQNMGACPNAKAGTRPQRDGTRTCKPNQGGSRGRAQTGRRRNAKGRGLYIDGL
ncbi:hypothetical protein Vafri_2176, partial [Volvox africanus]